MTRELIPGPGQLEEANAAGELPASPVGGGQPQRPERVYFSSLTKSRDNNYDFIRFALATLVLFGHGFHALNRTGVPYDPMFWLTRNQAQLGHLAVYGFFAISGVLVTASWERVPNAVVFFRNRALRIYPGFIACYLICLLVVAPLSGITWQQYRHQLNLPLAAAKILLLRGFGGFDTFPSNAIHTLNTSLWTIPWEFGCYILVAVVGMFGRYRRHAILIGAVASYALHAFCILAYGTPLEWVPPGMRDAVRSLVAIPGIAPSCVFMLGAAFHVLQQRIPFSGKIAWLAFAVMAIAARFPPCLELVVPFAIPYLVLFAAHHPALRLHHFAKRADLSYGIYLWGWPIQQMITRFLEPQLNGIGLFLIAMPIVSLLAYASWTFVEAPFMRMKSRRVPTERPALAR